MKYFDGDLILTEHQVSYLAKLDCMTLDQYIRTYNLEVLED